MKLVWMEKQLWKYGLSNLKQKKPSLLCLFHYNVTNDKRLGRTGLWDIYLHNFDFRYEVRIYCANMFLEEDEMDQFRMEQEKIVYKTIKKDKNRTKALIRAFVKSYVLQYKTRVGNKKLNFFRRDQDFTENSAESRNRRMQEEMGTDKSLLSLLNMWQKK
eukprot:62662_1